uniref:F-box domain-containing protein n=1 Tax=Anopheles epiroticus TaxID=199890 RepID=A0A182PYR3_9DIPT
MDISSCVCPINGLPPEVMYHIFDHLDIDSLKSVSLACKRWGQLFSEYAARRFTLSIRGELAKTLSCHTAGRHTRGGEKIASAATILQRTERVYRKVRLEVRSPVRKKSSNEYMETVLRMLCVPPMLQKLVVLKLELEQDSDHYFQQISDAVTKMEYLQELHLLPRDARPLWPLTALPSPCNNLRLVSHSLTTLVLRVILPGEIDCSNLRHLEYDASLYMDGVVGEQYAHNRGQESKWKLKQLETLKITGRDAWPKDAETVQNRPGYKVLFYQQLTQLKKLCLDQQFIPDRILLVVCESCVLLEELYIRCLRMVNNNTLRYLSNLTHLRRLGIYMLNASVPFYVSGLHSLEMLALGPVVLDPQSFTAPQSFKWLKITPYKVKQMCDAIEQNLGQLEFLWIVIKSSISDVSKELFMLVYKMFALKTLVLENIDCVPTVTLAKMPRLFMLTRLAVFTSSEAALKTIDDKIAILADLTPNVKRIEVGLHAPSGPDDVFRFR